MNWEGIVMNEELVEDIHERRGDASWIGGINDCDEWRMSAGGNSRTKRRWSKFLQSQKKQ